jgi:phosphate starvation-inducible membrane PsiE
MKGRKRREKYFVLKNRELPYTLGRIVAYLIFREPISKLLQVICCGFFLRFFLYLGKGSTYRVVVVNAATQ